METGHAESLAARGQWWTHGWGCTKDGPGPALSCIRLSTLTLTTPACEDLPGSSRGYYFIATDALRLAQLEGASTTEVSHSRGTFVVVAVATTFLPLTPSGLRSWWAHQLLQVPAAEAPIGRISHGHGNEPGLQNPFQNGLEIEPEKQ